MPAGFSLCGPTPPTGPQDVLTKQIRPGIPFAFEDYLALVDYTGRAIAPRKKGAIAKNTQECLSLSPRSNAPAYEDFSDHPLLRAGLAALAWAFIKQFHPEQLARLLRDLPDEHPLTRQILIYIVRVHTMTEDEFKQGVAMAKPHLVEALTMSLAQEWMDRGEAKGLQKGIQQGLQQGLQQGEAQTLLRQIERKFGAQARMHCQQRVQQADEAQLLQWIDNILTAERIEDVFQNDASLQ